MYIKTINNSHKDKNEHSINSTVDNTKDSPKSL